MTVNINKSDTTLIIQIDKRVYSFPSDKVILTQDKESDAVNVKLMGSRKTILTLPLKDLSDFKN